MLRPWDLQIAIDQSGKKAVYIQIADAIIAAIKSGKLVGGDALPGSRQLAAKLSVNRNTVIEALDVLLAEGWLVARPRRGTFIAQQLPLPKASQQVTAEPAPKVSTRVPDIIFDDGLPDTRIAPINELAAAYRQIFNRKGRWQLMGYSDGAGEEDFRTAITQMLNYNRGMRLSPDEIFITRGSQMAMFLIAHSLLVPGDTVVVENPGYSPAWRAFEHAGARLIGVGVDGDGLIISELITVLQSQKVKAIYVTPHHQFPTTVTLTLQRRLELVALSNQYGFTIIEDDYDNEFHFEQRPILPVCSYDSLENFVYIGTMSKIVAPALRIGYLASSRKLIGKVRELRSIIDVQGDNIMAQAILQLIDDGHIKRHLRKATLHYRAKRDLFAGLLIRHLSGKVDFQKPDGGLAFWVVPRAGSNVGEMAKLLLEKGVQVIPPDFFSFGEPVNGLRLGYGSLSEEQLKEGIRLLATVL